MADNEHEASFGGDGHVVIQSCPSGKQVFFILYDWEPRRCPACNKMLSVKMDISFIVQEKE
jgi:hypothetical protein